MDTNTGHQDPPTSNAAAEVPPTASGTSSNGTEFNSLPNEVTKNVKESVTHLLGANETSVPQPTLATSTAPPSTDEKDSAGADAAGDSDEKGTKTSSAVDVENDAIKEATATKPAAVSSGAKPDSSSQDASVRPTDSADVAPEFVAAKTSVDDPSSDLVKEGTVAGNGDAGESKPASTDVLDPQDARVLEDLGRRYPKRAREQTWDSQADKKEKKSAGKKKKKEDEETAEQNEPPPGPPPDANVGRYVEQSKLLGTTTGQFYPLNGKIVEYRSAEGRIPGRYAVQWEYPTADGETAGFIQEDEWVTEDLQAFDESVAKGNAPIMTYSAYKSTSYSHHPPPLKLALDNVRQRFQQVVERDLGDSHIVSTLIVVAALEEALQSSLQQQHETESGAVVSSGTGSSKKSSKPHPPLYYTSNPSSYLTPPSTDNSNSSSSSLHPKAQMTPTILAQRLRQGCQWAWTYLQSKQEQMPLLKAPVGKRSIADILTSDIGASDAAAIAAAVSDNGSSVAQRRSVRAARFAPTSYGEDDGITTGRARSAPPGSEDPNPVQRGGRVAMWWMKALEDKPSKNLGEPRGAEADIADIVPASPKPKNGKKGAELDSKNAESGTKDEDVEMATESFEEEEQDEDTKDDDDDYTGGDGEQDEDDESLEGVEKERGRLSPVADPEVGEEIGDFEVEEEEEEDEDRAIMWKNPYLQSSFPAFLEFLARPKSITMEEIQKAMDQITLKIRHNKRSAENGIALTDLTTSDEVILGFEIPDHPSSGKVVLKCVSGETAGELQRLDVNTFSRCKFELEIIGDEEKAIQIRRKEDILQQEIEFKERKAWDRWRFRGIQEGYAVWPDWEGEALTWVKENVKSEASAAAEASQAIEESKDDEALAKSLEEIEAVNGGRRRTARRAAATATEGVFYGNQSQLTQKQLMDALLRLVKANPFQTLIKLQSLVADDSSDPIRRCRIALGKMLWKRNLIARKSVTTQIGERSLAADLDSGKLLVRLESISVPNENESSSKDLLDYLCFLQRNELRLRELILKQLSDIPIPVIATAADERIGSLESLDDNDFENASSIEWKNSGHPLLQHLIYRPPTQSVLGMETTPCNWYKVIEFSESIKSEEDDAEDYAMERRVRFRAEPSVGPDTVSPHDGEVLVLTEAQVHAGAKAAEMQRHQISSIPSSNPYARISGDSVTLVPLDSGEDGENPSPTEICGRIVGHDSRVNIEDSEIEYRVFILPHPDAESKQDHNAFWAILDVRADDSSYVCQPEGQSTWYIIENQDFHQDSEAYRECEKVLNWLSSQSKASPFMSPVDPVALGIPSYPQIVKHPMDISTITHKLENGHYASIPPGQSYGHSPASRMLNGPFRKDIELMFDNAVLFNPPDDWIHQAALSLKKSAVKKIETASSAAERAYRSAGGRQKNSLYVYDDSDQDMYEYESDQDDEYGGGGRRKRKRENRGSTNKDEAAARPMEHTIRLHNCLKDGNDLRGPFASLCINTDASTFSLPRGWSCRRRIASSNPTEETHEEKAEEAESADADKKSQDLAREMADLVALHKAIGENETSGLRRSTRANHPSDGCSNKAASKVDDLEYFLQASHSEDLSVSKSLTSRLDIEVLLEERHEDHYSKLYFQLEKELIASGRFGAYSSGSFPPYLGRVSPSKNKHSMTWEIRSAFAVPAIRWVIRGLISSGHLTAVEPMTSDITSGVIIKNDIYYWDPKLQPFEVLDTRGLQRRKRADVAEEESDDDFEMSEYEKARAERVARNAERLRALGLA